MRDNESSMKCRICYWPKDLCECCIQSDSLERRPEDYVVTAQERVQPEDELSCEM